MTSRAGIAGEDDDDDACLPHELPMRWPLLRVGLLRPQNTPLGM